MLGKGRRVSLVIPNHAWARQDCDFHPLGKPMAVRYGDDMPRRMEVLYMGWREMQRLRGCVQGTLMASVELFQFD